MTRPLDTSPEAHRVQLEILRQLGPDRRLQASFELTRLARQLLREGIRQRHPEYDQAQLRLALIRRWLGDDALFRQAYPDAPLLAP